jgi:RNA polymerase sigma-70 factor (sigma-E family)
VVPVVWIARDVGFEDLFDAEQRGMLRLAYLLLGSPSMAEDAVQEAFAKVYERWDQIDTPGAFLRRCVVNECNTRHRRLRLASRRRHLLAGESSVDDAYPELADALRALPLRRRSVVVMRHYLQMNTAEIAEELGISEGTVKSSLHRGLHQLKGYLT